MLVAGWRLAGAALDAARAGSCQRATREKYDEAFAGNGTTHKYRVDMLV
jgi:hypothetical protein